MSIKTNVNIVTKITGNMVTIDNLTRIEIALANARRMRFRVQLPCNDDTMCVHIYPEDPLAGFMAVLDREFMGVKIRDENIFEMDVNAIYRGKIFAQIISGVAAVDLMVMDYFDEG